ncbi:MAG TPA: ATP-binding protein [Acidimicrobiales bacterium]|nr:ATP-binding protein [Acidimicrobiales bacterium]
MTPPDQPSVRASSLRGRLTGVFTIGGVLLVLIMAASGLALAHLIDARHTLLNEIDPASLAADQLLVAYVDQETGIRGYVLSHDTTFLQPFDQGLIAQKSTEAVLYRTLADDPDLLQLARQATTQASIWQKRFASPAVISTAHGGTAYESVPAELRGKHFFDGIRTRFDRLDAALSTSRGNAGNNLDSATTELEVALAAAALLVIAGGLILRRALRRWVIDPLSELGAETRLVATGELAHPIITRGTSAELQELGHDVESMRQRIVNELHEVAAARGDLKLRNEDLARSNLELEQFAYVASHDLQEPLRKVTSFVQLLQQRYEGQLDERADQYIHFAVDGAKRMQGLISDLLTFSRVGRTTERFEPVDLSRCLQMAMANLATVIEETGAQIEVSDLPTVLGDRSLLVSLWQNLLGNSIKFRGDASPLVVVTADQRAGQWLLTVTDNGIGIEPRFAEKIFVIFQRLHGRESYEGTGIGLALCRKIVEFHGGTMWLDESHVPGARLCFNLPVPVTEEGQ